MTKGIYCYIDNEKDRVVYVGKDVKIDKNQRHRDHLVPSNYNAQVINRILQNNPGRYTYHKLEEFSDDFSDSDLFDLERFYIEELHTYHYDYSHGFNFTKGGEGMTGFRYSEKTRKKMSKTQNTTGFYGVDKDKHNTCNQGFMWRYRYRNKLITKSIRSVNLLKLQEKVEARGLPWKIVDEEKAQKSLEENNKMGEAKNTTGFYRVSKHKNKNVKQGFRWCYIYQNKKILSVNLLKLQKKVEAQNLPWEIVNEEKAQKSLEENNKMGEAKNTTGFYRVSKQKDNNCKQGFMWRYQYPYKSTRKSIYSTNLKKLEKKVKAQNLPWQIVNENKARQSLKKDIGDI